MTVLVAADLRGIQAFVYSSRQLLDAIGRAALVNDLTDPTRPDLARMLRKHGGDVVMAGAGGLLISFKEEPAARAFTADWTRWVYDTTDHLHAVVVHLTGDRPDSTHPGRVATALRRARATTDTTHEPFLDPGFAASCAVTGRPAALLQDSKSRGIELLSREIADARQAGRSWHERQTRDLLDGLTSADPPWTLTTQLDELGRQTGDISKLAVIHADVNSLGAALSRHATHLAEFTGDPAQAPLPQLEVSAALTAVITAVHRHLVAAVIRSAAATDTGWRITGFPAHLGVTVATPEKSPGPVVPIRPVVAAGDDLTVVCDARLAWSLTRLMLDWLDTPVTDLPAGDPRRVLAAAGPEFSRSSPDGAPQVNLTIGVGIATFNVGAPFATAYDAAAEMCNWAKDVRQQNDWDDHVIAWTRPDRPPAARLAETEQLRAVGLTKQPYQGDAFRNLMDELLGDVEGSLRSTSHKVARSWIKTLHTLAEGGPKAVRADTGRRKANDAVTLPTVLVDRILAGAPQPATDWSKHPTPILDALGLLDLHLDLTTDRTAAALAGPRKKE